MALKFKFLAALMITAMSNPALAEAAADLEAALTAAGANQTTLRDALRRVPGEHRAGLQWLIIHMPQSDRESLQADFLLENVELAYDVWATTPWRDSVPEAVFLDSVLPYASVNEERGAWRRSFRDQFAPLIAEAKTPAEAAAILNNKIFEMVGVQYSTQRPKPDQSPAESIEAGMASCTGLSVLLVDACRSVGVPARFVGTPLWSDGSGNHSWVEIWDDDTWHFTGAAEPTGMALDKAWFTGRASGAIEGDPDKAVFAVTWRDVPLHFPMVWRPDDTSVGAVDVTRRYTVAAAEAPEGQMRLRIRVVDGQGLRVQKSVLLRGTDTFGSSIEASGLSRDERFDANDHLELQVPLGADFTISLDGKKIGFKGTAEGDEQLVTLTLAGDQASQWNQALSRQAAEDLRRETIGRWRVAQRDRARAELDAGVLRHGDLTMPFSYKVGEAAPLSNRPLVISMHGGGGGPSRMNDGQWKNQQKLYHVPEGIYLAPRAPTNTWNLWHQEHIDPLFDRLITDMILAEAVDPDRVYLTGYSAGGDGVYQLAPRMADRFAAAAMMAGHPNETRPDGLRNLPMTLQVGEHDTPYQRNRVTREWGEQLDALQQADPQGYEHWVEIHEGKGHWMDRQDAAALPWMARYRRVNRPSRIVWLQDDVRHQRFYWLRVDDPVARVRLVVERDGQRIRILESAGVPAVTIRLDDEMLDLDQPVVVEGPTGAVLFEGMVPRLGRVIMTTLAERGDPSGVYTAEVSVALPN